MLKYSNYNCYFDIDRSLNFQICSYFEIYFLKMMPYKDQLDIYSNKGVCYCGRFNEFSQYIAEYAKDRKGHGLDLGAGPHGYNG